MSEPIYRSIAVAATFSPRFLQVLAEANRVRQRFDAPLSAIFVGHRDPATSRKFSDAFQKLKIPSDSIVHYEAGDPATAILAAAHKYHIGLLVAGALEREAVHRSFLGNVARRLIREAPCSVMLFTEPELGPKPMRHIVFLAEYSEHGSKSLRRTLHFAAREKSECVYVVRLITTFDEARAKQGGGSASESDEDTKLEHFVLALGHTDVPIEVRCIRGNTGFAAADFVKSVEADLLVVPLDPAKNSGQLPPNLEWLIDVIPCNLWLAR